MLTTCSCGSSGRLQQIDTAAREQTVVDLAVRQEVFQHRRHHASCPLAEREKTSSSNHAMPQGAPIHVAGRSAVRFGMPEQYRLGRRGGSAADAGRGRVGWGRRRDGDRSIFSGGDRAGNRRRATCERASMAVCGGGGRGRDWMTIAATVVSVELMSYIVGCKQLNG